MRKPPEQRPNILILMSDEHRADVTGYAGDTVIRTPTLDWLANTGVTFDNAYTPSPVCVPARQSIMAGQYPHTTGCERFHQDLQPGHMTYARRFSQHGYNTVCAGKLHHRGPDQLQGWTCRIAGDTKLNREHTERLLEARGKTDYSLKWTDAKELSRAGVGRGPHQDDDQFTLDSALNFIRRYFIDSEYDNATPGDPLMLKVSFARPHYPYFTDKDRFEYYLNRVKPYTEQEVFEHPVLAQKTLTAGVDVSERDIRRAMAAYYGMIESMDEDFQKIFNALEFAGQNLDDWIIVYLSDHGEMLGEHCAWEKFKFFEGSVRTPFVIRWPKRFPGGSRISVNVSLCDLFATLCDMCDLPIPEGLDSRSLAPLMDGDAAGWDNVVSAEYWGTHLMIKRDELKYQWYGPDAPEVLFDLKLDPGETKNCIGEPQYQDTIAHFRNEREMRGFGVGETVAENISLG